MLRKVKKFLLYFFVFLLVSFLLWAGYLVKGGRDAVILMYHSVGESDGWQPGLNIPTQAFLEQMEFLKKHDYNVVSLDELADMLKSGSKIPPKTVVITFDDGYMNNYTRAYPILRRLGFPATFFIVFDFLGAEKEVYGRKMRFMTPEIIKEMLASGIVTIGSHTLKHFYLPDITDEEALREEIAGSKEALERITGQEVKFFSYPIGGYTPKIRDIVGKAGYKAAVTTMPSKGYAHEDIYALKRIKMTERAGNPVIFFISTSGYYLRMKEMNR